jgi:hypothetical protein
MPPLANLAIHPGFTTVYVPPSAGATANTARTRLSREERLSFDQGDAKRLVAVGLSFDAQIAALGRRLA